MRTIRASEIGAYLYCRRAWWYQRQGLPSENQENLAAGTAVHRKHGQAVLTAGCLRAVAYVLLLAAAAAMAAYFTLQAF
jgi:CRISPR/Cas system-associated exonuclease Cas4 (RecB family)